MAIRTGIIKYNLNDRKRTHTGKPRQFDIPKLVSLINSDEIQERVKNGDITGYYGHWPRIKFGMNPREGGVVDGKVVNLEPCHKTIYLKAYDDGTIEHEEEFLDNDPGMKAEKLLEGKMGGFSSAISLVNGMYQFFGFDFVHAPNYSGNRPYALDDADAEESNPFGVLILDDIEDADKLIFEREYLLDQIDDLKQANGVLIENNTLLTDSIESLSDQNDWLIQETVDLKLKIEETEKDAVFDSVTLDDAIAEAEKFKTQKILDATEPSNEPKDSPESEYIKTVFG